MVSQDKKLSEKLISIIIPVYNVEDYILDCLESVASQIYNKDVECILIDDGSKDKSVEIIQSFINSYKGPIAFVLHVQEKNRGQAAARNVGLAFALGEYVYFMDSDDVIEPFCLECFIFALKQYPHVDIIQGGMITLDGRLVMSTKSYPDYVDDRLWIKQKFLLPGGINPAPWNRLMRKQLLDDYNIRFHEGIKYEDVPFTYSIGQHAESIAFVKQSTYRYRIHREGSTISTVSDMEAITYRLSVLNDLISMFNDCFPKLQVRSIMLKFMLYHNIHSIECVKRYNIELKEIYSRLSSLMPWYYQMIGKAYTILPLFIKRSHIFDKLFRTIYSLNIN